MRILMRRTVDAGEMNNAMDHGRCLAAHHPIRQCTEGQARVVLHLLTRSPNIRYMSPHTLIRTSSRVSLHAGGRQPAAHS
jgi:hypothetical protein